MIPTHNSLRQLWGINEQDGAPHPIFTCSHSHVSVGEFQVAHALHNFCATAYSNFELVTVAHQGKLFLIVHPYCVSLLTNFSHDYDKDFWDIYWIQIT